MMNNRFVKHLNDLPFMLELTPEDRASEDTVKGKFQTGEIELWGGAGNEVVYAVSHELAQSVFSHIVSVSKDKGTELPLSLEGINFFGEDAEVNDIVDQIQNQATNRDSLILSPVLISILQVACGTYTRAESKETLISSTILNCGSLTLENDAVVSVSSAIMSDDILGIAYSKGDIKVEIISIDVSDTDATNANLGKVTLEYRIFVNDNVGVFTQ